MYWRIRHSPVLVFTYACTYNPIWSNKKEITITYQLTCIERIAEESEGHQSVSSSVPAGTTDSFGCSDRQVTTTNTLTKGIRYR